MFPYDFFWVSTMSLAVTDVAASPDLVITRLQEALVHHEAGRLEVAEAGYLAILKMEPGNPDAQHNLGMLMLGRGDAELALPHLSAALEAQPQNRRCWLSYAEALLIAGRADEARQVILVGRQAGLEGGDVDFLEARITVVWVNHPDLAGLRGLIAAGQVEVALTQLREQMLRFGEDTGLMALLAESLIQLGREAEALPWLKKVCVRTPEVADVWMMYGVVQNRLENFEEAYGYYLKALTLRPKDPAILAALGENLYEAGFFEEAYIWLRQAALIGGANWQTWQSLADILLKMGGEDDGMLAVAVRREHPPVGDEAECMLRVLELGINPERLPRKKKRVVKAPGAEMCNQLKRLLSSGQMDKALSQARVVCETYPLDSFGWKVLGAVLKAKESDPDMALTAMRLGLAAAPDDAEGYTNLAVLYSDTSHFAEAEAAARRALVLQPGFVKGYTTLADALREQGKLVDAREQLQIALDLAPWSHPGRANMLNNFGHIEGQLGDTDAALGCYRKVLELDSGLNIAHSNLLFFLSHRADQGAVELFAEHCRYGDVFELPLRNSWPKHQNTLDPERCLQVGFVSGDLYNHAIANFIEPIFAQLAECPGVCMHVYYNNSVDDAATVRLRGYVKHWQRVDILQDAILAKQIEADGIDILIDLSGHTAKNRLPVFARKPAPIQASWMGYPGTTGLKAMDYYIADSYFLPPAQFAGQFTEKLLCLPASAPFLPFDAAPPVNELPALQAGYLTFGSFNRLDKLSSTTIVLWSQLLRALPETRMLIGGLPLDLKQDRLIEAFAREGIDRERLDFHPRSSMASYLALHHQVDICLDAYPYAGGTTTFHALWMGVPTLSIAGATPAGRAGASIAAHVGLQAFVASDAADFVTKGVAWATNVSDLARIRAGLRNDFDRSAMGRPDVIAAGLEKALRIAWRRWCEGLPAESIEVKMSDL